MQYGIFGGNGYSITIFITLVPQHARVRVEIYIWALSCTYGDGRCHAQAQQKVIYGNNCYQTQEIFDCGVSVFLKLSLCRFYNIRVYKLKYCTFEQKVGSVVLYNLNLLLNSFCILLLCCHAWHII